MTGLMKDAASGAAGRIVLLHALGRSRWSMWLLARRLRAAGWPVAMVGYPSLRLPIEAAAERVARDVATVSRGWGTGSGQVHLVGHSLGGIIARRLALSRSGLEPGLRIARVVQIGSPNLGTNVGTGLARRAVMRWLFGPVLVQAAAFPARVARHEAVGAIAGTGHCGWLNAPLGLDGPNDGLVTVRSAWGGAGVRAAVPVSHSFLPFSTHGARLVAGFLRDGRFDIDEGKR
jgi:pimeloyl-ACP methyl ester carboxylesterase